LLIVSRLHQEICDFYDFIKPQEYEKRIREDLMNRLEKIFCKPFPKSRLYAFGSFAQGIYLPTSDMDLVLFSPDFQRSGRVGFNHKKALYMMRQELVSARIIKRAQDATVIAKAKVPIIKFVDEATGLNCDISLDNDSGIKALTTFEKWKRTWPFLPKLLSVLKQWLLMRGINEVFNGGLGGFSLTCMLVSMLQQRVDGQTQNLDSSSYLGELLLDFFDLYGNKLNMDRVGIDMMRTELFNKVSPYVSLFP
jgi:non-canonical poly(A) RNA polymerase PAPD5/7